MMEVFTTVRVENGKPVYLAEHLDRLRWHAMLAGLVIPAEAGIQDWTPAFAGVTSGLVRISIAGGNYHFTTRPLPKVPNGSVKIILSSQIATSQLKTNRREVYDVAMSEARSAGAFEALLCSPEGYVVDATRSSPFLIQGQKVISLLGGIDGITRRKHLEQLSTQGFEVYQAYLKPHELQGQLWIAGSGVGVLNTNLV